MKYSILLHMPADDTALGLYKSLATEVEYGGKPVLWIQTDDPPDTDNVHYLHVKLRAPDGGGMSVWIPHHYVLMIGGDLDERKMGFRAGG